MQFDKTQKRALVFVAGLLGLSWYMGNQYEKADMMRSEADAYTYAYNEGHSDSRKEEDYQPVLTSGREEARFRKILKQRAEAFATQRAETSDMIYVPMSLGSYSCEPEILGIFGEEKDAISAIHDSIKEENTEFYHEEDSLIWTDEDDNRWELHIYSKSILSGLESYGAETFRAENMIYILEHYTVNWREGGDSVEYHIGTSLMNLADALTDALDTLEEHNRHEEWCEDAKTDEEYEDRVERWEGRDGEDENGLLDLLMEVQGDGYGLDNLNRYTLTVKEAPAYLRGSSEYYAETFNAPYAGSGSLMNIGQDTSLGNFTSKELTESSAIHGDFNEASLNYSGHQNLQVRGAEAETMTPSEVEVKVTKDVTPKGSKVIVEECVDIQAHKADATANFYRVRFRDPAEMSNFRVPAWAARAANTMGSKYYDVAGSKVTMGQDKSGNWKIQSVMVPKRANVDVELALKIANHIQDRLEKEGRWASKKCQDNERILIIR